MADTEIKADSNLRLLKVFQTEEEAKEICKILEENNIAFELTDSQPPLLLTTDTKKFQLWLLVSEEDQENAIGLIESIGLHGEGVSEKETYYLFDFTNEELWQVLENQDEWSNEDYELSIKILTDRGIEVSPEKLSKLKIKRIEFLSKPEKGDKGWLIFGWVMILAGGLFGALIGWHHKTFQKSLPDGSRVLLYDEPTRNIGSKMFILGSIFFVVWVLVIIVISLL